MDTWFSYSVHLLDVNKYAFIAYNINDKMKLEQDGMKTKELLESLVLSRTKELQDALAVKSRFLATMSHGNPQKSNCSYLRIYGNFLILLKKFGRR